MDSVDSLPAFMVVSFTMNCKLHGIQREEILKFCTAMQKMVFYAVEHVMQYLLLEIEEKPG